MAAKYIFILKLVIVTFISNFGPSFALANQMSDCFDPDLTIESKPPGCDSVKYEPAKDEVEIVKEAEKPVRVSGCFDPNLTIESKPHWCDSIDFKQYQDELDFVKESIYAVRTELRASLFMSDLYISCLLKDADWFEKYGDNLKSLPYCRFYLKTLKKNILKDYQRMRLLLGISQYSFAGVQAPFIMDDTKIINSKAMEAYIHVDIKHPFNNMVAIPPLTAEEVTLAAELLSRDIEGRKQWRTHRKILKDTHCADKSTLGFIYAGDECYKDHYKRILIGDKEKKIRGAPILAFIKNGDPNKFELIEAIIKIKKNTKHILKNFEEKYFDFNAQGVPSIKPLNFTIEKNLELFFFVGPIERMTMGREAFQELLDEALDMLSFKGGVDLGVQMGGIVAWSIGCGIFLKSAVAKGLCELPVGLGANYAFYVIDSEIFNQVSDFIFYRPDGLLPSGKELNLLNEVELGKNISSYMMPFFTGVPKLGKALKDAF